MATVVLIGFSCAGKSTIADLMSKRHASLQVFDSDKWISRGHTDALGESHIYNMFVELGRERAVDEIAKRERAFLSQLTPTAEPRLIAAGPALVSREPDWQQFVDRVDPHFVYLTQSAEQAAAGLAARRARQIGSQLAFRQNFGSWDEGILTTRNTDRWVDVAPELIVPHVRTHMHHLVKTYERLTPSDTDRFPIEVARSDDGRDRVLGRVTELAGLD